MAMPFERTRTLVSAKEFLEAMLDPKQPPRTPRWMLGRAKALLKHYPGLVEIEMVHKALSDKSGSVPPFSRRHEIPRTIEVGLDKIGAKK